MGKQRKNIIDLFVLLAVQVYSGIISLFILFALFAMQVYSAEIVLEAENGDIFSPMAVYSEPEAAGGNCIASNESHPYRGWTNTEGWVSGCTGKWGWSDKPLAARSCQPELCGHFDCLTNTEGIDVDINLRIDTEHDGNAENECCNQYGVEYHYIGIPDDKAFTRAQLVEAINLIADRNNENKAVEWHCAGGTGRAGVIEAVFLMWRGWSTDDAFNRYLEFAAKIDPTNGGDGQVQLLNDVGEALGRGPINWPKEDVQPYTLESCPDRPEYMNSGEYDFSNIGSELRERPLTAGHARLAVDVPASGLYYVWIRLKAEDDNSNSVWLLFDHSNITNMEILAGDASTGGWTWVNYCDGNTGMRMTVDLTEGSHTVDIISREADTEIDELILSTDEGYEPNLTEGIIFLREMERPETFATLMLYDSFGRKLEDCRINKAVKNGNHFRNNLGKGIYFMSLQEKEYRIGRRIVIVE